MSKARHMCNSNNKSEVTYWKCAGKQNPHICVTVMIKAEVIRSGGRRGRCEKDGNKICVKFPRHENVSENANTENSDF